MNECCAKETARILFAKDVLAEDRTDASKITHRVSLSVCPAVTFHRPDRCAATPSADRADVRQSEGFAGQSADSVARLIDVCRGALNRGETPVVEAYALGKAQEVTRILTGAGIGVLQPKQVYEISLVYEACGMPLGNFAQFQNLPLEGHALVVPPGAHRGSGLQGIRRPCRITVTGWSLDAGSSRRYGFHHAIPLSDHADFDELVEAVRMVEAREVYCTHGPESFVERLIERGFNAFRLGKVPATTKLMF